MLASVGVIARNEEGYLPGLLADILTQTYDRKKIQLLLVDSGSTDGTRAIMDTFAADHKMDFADIQVLDNPKMIQASGWNRVIGQAAGEVIFRIDAHAHLPADFIEKNMALQAAGEYVTGGSRPCLIKDPTPWKKLLLATENSLFGSSIGRNKSGYVNSMFHAAYRREVFQKAGVFNENLLRTEDNEMHYRIRRAGYRLYSSETVISWQYARSSLKDMLRQKFGNGMWVGLTLGVCPGCISLYHLVPAGFVLGVLTTTLLALFGFWHPAVLMWGLYGIFCLAGMVLAVVKKETGLLALVMPVLFLLLHLCYGVGTWAGIEMLPGRKKQLSGKGE